MADTGEIEWEGDIPTRCELCDGNLEGTFYDAKLRKGPWAILCLKCLGYEGVGLGPGRGQKYELQGGVFIQTAGGVS